jgi:hypothetical protein
VQGECDGLLIDHCARKFFTMSDYPDRTITILMNKENVRTSIDYLQSDGYTYENFDTTTGKFRSEEDQEGNDGILVCERTKKWLTYEMYIV